jgi:hypothetical protein
VSGTCVVAIPPLNTETTDPSKAALQVVVSSKGVTYMPSNPIPRPPNSRLPHAMPRAYVDAYSRVHRHATKTLPPCIHARRPPPSPLAQSGGDSKRIRSAHIFRKTQTEVLIDLSLLRRDLDRPPESLGLPESLSLGAPNLSDPELGPLSGVDSPCNTGKFTTRWMK